MGILYRAMIWASYYIDDRCDNLDPRGNCVKRDIEQIFGLEHATNDFVNSIQNSICLWVFIALHVGLSGKSLRNWIKLFLNSEPLLKIILCGLGYIDSHNPLNVWDILSKNLSMLGTYAISNHSVAGFIKVIHNTWSSFVSILFTGYLTLVSIVYAPLIYTHIVFRGVKISSSLSGSNPYLALLF